MQRAVLAEMTRRGGVITREEALGIASRHALERALRSGRIVRVFPRTFALRELAAEQDIRRLAATKCVAGSALSHLDALGTWALLAGEGTHPTVHVTTSHDSRHPRSVAGLVVHRRQGFRARPPLVVVRTGLPVVRLEQAVVESWPLLPLDQRRATAIVAVRERRTTPARLTATLDRQRRTAGAAEMGALFLQLAEGCHSELELWGLAHVFDHPDLPASRAQLPVTIGGRTCYLDRAFHKEQVDVELDGAAYHFMPEQRRRDMHRDELLASAGWLVLRFSAARLRTDPVGARRRLVEVLATRRRQLRIP